MNTFFKTCIVIIFIVMGIYQIDSDAIEEENLHNAPKIHVNYPWDVHFSARNFYTRDEQKELKSSQIVIKKAFISLPESHRSTLNKIEIRNQDHISRGMANSKKLIINTGKIKTQKELKSVFIHEMGHVFDLGTFRGDKWTGKSEYKDGKNPIYNNDKSLEFYRISWQSAIKKKANARNGDFVSGYAKSDIFEDFAESYIFYRLHGEKFRAKSRKSSNIAKKYNFLKTQVFSGREYQTNKKEYLLKKDIWDVTLL